MTKSGDAREDFIGGLGPHERLGTFVGNVDIAQDRRLQFARTAMNAAPQLFVGERGEPALHEVDPRGTGRREVHVEPGVAHQPPVDQRGLVGAVVIENDGHAGRRRHRRIDGVEKRAELFRPCRWWNSPMTLPVLTLSAAKSEVVPCRT